MGILTVPTVTDDTVDESIDIWEEISDGKKVEFKLVLSENDVLFYYFTDQDPSSISVEHRNQYTEKELQDILDQYPVTTLINAGNSSESVIFDLCNKILKKSGNKSIFIGQSIMDSDLKFKFNSGFEDFDDAPINDPDPMDLDAYEDYEPDGRDMSEMQADLTAENDDDDEAF
tara:strand:+ start:45 stop:563 length:519 start_codon:yes stop_codon:yes gene_type:complete